jgi:hypothetical protein
VATAEKPCEVKGLGRAFRQHPFLGIRNALPDTADPRRSGEAEMMRLISRAASWHVLDSEEYDRLSQDFQEQAGDLERHAKARNLDAAALDYMRISLTCVQCHKYVREVRGRKTP